jgi:hypothetical protein
VHASKSSNNFCLQYSKFLNELVQPASFTEELPTSATRDCIDGGEFFYYLFKQCNIKEMDLKSTDHQDPEEFFVKYVVINHTAWICTNIFTMFF